MSQIGLSLISFCSMEKFEGLYIPVGIKTGLSNGRFRMDSDWKLQSDENGFSDVWLINAAVDSMLYNRSFSIPLIFVSTRLVVAFDCSTFTRMNFLIYMIFIRDYKITKRLERSSVLVEWDTFDGTQWKKVF